MTQSFMHPLLFCAKEGIKSAFLAPFSSKMISLFPSVFMHVYAKNGRFVFSGIIKNSQFCFAEINAHIYHQKYFPYNGAFIWVVWHKWPAVSSSTGSTNMSVISSRGWHRCPRSCGSEVIIETQVDVLLMVQKSQTTTWDYIYIPTYMGVSRFLHGCV